MWSVISLATLHDVAQLVLIGGVITGVVLGALLGVRSGIRECVKFEGGSWEALRAAYGRSGPWGRLMVIYGFVMDPLGWAVGFAFCGIIFGAVVAFILDLLLYAACAGVNLVAWAL